MWWERGTEPTHPPGGTHHRMVPGVQVTNGMEGMVPEEGGSMVPVPMEHPWYLWNGICPELTSTQNLNPESEE